MTKISSLNYKLYPYQGNRNKKKKKKKKKKKHPDREEESCNVR